MKQTVSISKEFNAKINSMTHGTIMSIKPDEVSKTMSELLDSELDKFNNKNVKIKISLQIEEE